MNVPILVEGLKRKKIEKLPESYNPLGLSPHSNHLGLRRKKALHLHRMDVLRYWEINASSPKDEAVAQLFEGLLEKAKNEMKEKDRVEGTEEGDAETDTEIDRSQTQQTAEDIEEEPEQEEERAESGRQPGAHRGEENEDPNRLDSCNSEHSRTKQSKKRGRQHNDTPVRSTTQKTGETREHLKPIPMNITMDENQGN